MSRVIIESYLFRSQSAAFDSRKTVICGRSRRNFRVVTRVSPIEQANERGFSLILLNFAFGRQLLREARHLLETSLTFLRLSWES
jgi:hypothetical protein